MALGLAVEPAAALALVGLLPPPLLLVVAPGLAEVGPLFDVGPPSAFLPEVCRRGGGAAAFFCTAMPVECQQSVDASELGSVESKQVKLLRHKELSACAA